MDALPEPAGWKDPETAFGNSFKPLCGAVMFAVLAAVTV
jgi:hypothetical protein